MAQQEADVAATELEHVDKVVPTLFEREGPFYQWMDTAEDVEISNRDARVPLEVWSGGNFGHYDPDGGALGLGSAPKYDKAVINSQHLRMGTQYTRKAEWATESGRKAVVNTVRRLSASAIAEFRRYIDSLMMTNGQGILGTISAVSNSGGFDTITLGTDGFGSKLLRYSQEVAYYTSDLSAARDSTNTTNKTITYHDPVAKQIKSATTAALAATDKVVVGGLGTVVGASVISLLGVPYHHSNASSGTWLGLDRATYPQIRANGINANNGSISLSYVRRAINIIGDRVGMDNMKNQVAWMHPCQVQAIESLGWGLTTIQKSAREEGMNLFFNVDQLAGIPIKKSFSWDKTRIDFTVKGVWKKVVFKQPGLYKKGSETLFDIRSTTDGSPKTSLVFYYVIGTNTYVNNPPLCSYIYALAVPTGY
jgi:hypothetical protein